MRAAKWSTRTTLWIIAFTVVLAIIIRYPLVEHERFQTDSYFIHILSESVVRNGYAVWTYHPLSYFGYYPVSYPSGYPMIISELTILTGLSVEGSILVSTLALGALFGIVVFCLSRDMLFRTELAIIAMVLATLAPRFVDTTYWNASSRGPEVVLVALLLMLWHRTSMVRSRSLIVLTVSVTVACFAVHHMAIFLLLFGLSWVLTRFAVGSLSRSSGFPNRIQAIIICTLVVFLAGVGFIVMSPSGSQTIITEFGRGFFSLDLEIMSAMLNMGVSYTHQIGVVLMLVPFAFYLVILKGKGSTRLFFPLVTILTFIPVVDRSLYVSMILLPFVCVLGAFTLGPYLFKKSSRSRVVIVASLIVLSLAVCQLSVDRWNDQTYLTGDKVAVGNQVFSDAMYLSVSYEDVPTIANQNLRLSQIGALSQLRVVGSTIYMSLSGYLTGDDLRNSVDQADVDFPSNLYVWFSYDDTLYIERLVKLLFVEGTSYLEMLRESESEFLSGNTMMLVLIDNHWPNEYSALYGASEATLPRELLSAETSTGAAVASYCVYSTEGMSAYIWKLPIEL